MRVRRCFVDCRRLFVVYAECAHLAGRDNDITCAFSKHIASTFADTVSISVFVVSLVDKWILEVGV